MPVITASFARETQGWHRIQVRILPGIAVFIARETQNLALLSQQFFNIASKGLFFGVVLTDCYISNKYGQSVQSFFCAPITELCRVMSSFSAACSVSDTLTRFAKS